METTKYIFENGMLINTRQALVDYTLPLALVSSPQDINEASKAQQKATGLPLIVSDNVADSMLKMQGQTY